jgi:3-dehydroquinate dehydratase / shikimate dehydrogenase
MAELIAARDAAQGDMVELRLDGVSDLDVDAALHGRRLPVVVTCRPEWEGGAFSGDEEARHAVLARALELGAEFVDVEWATLHGPHAQRFAALVGRTRGRIVLSSHDFAAVPADLEARVRDMRNSGAAVIKIAVTVAGLAETLPLRGIAREGDAVVIGMGDCGVASRLLATLYGSRWTYAGNGVAPGQIPAGRMIDEFRFRSVQATTQVFGVVSATATHSLSPVMHNAAFTAAGLDAVYVPLQTADFADFLEFASALPVAGASVTIPFKRDALRAAARVDDVTREVGAANTLRLGSAEAGPRDGSAPNMEPGIVPSRDGGWEATNTDVQGFLEPLEREVGSLAGLRAAVVGAGGAARAVIVALLARGARVTVHARRREQAEDVTVSLGATLGPWPVPAGSWDVLINCTPLGGPMLRDESPLPAGPFTGRLVYDLTYGPGESALVREARQAGCATLDGLPMLIAQAERQFEWWTGLKPAPGVMRAAAERRLASVVAGTERPAQRTAVERTL